MPIFRRPLQGSFGEHYFDTLQHRGTSYKGYGVGVDALASSDPHQIVECIGVCMAWGRDAKIDHNDPLALETPAAIER